VQQFAKIILKEFAEVLKPESFRRKGNRFFHEGPDAILWIEMQKSRDSTDDRFVFTINLGAFVPKLARTLGDMIREIDILNGHWNARLGCLLPFPGDRWWEVRSDEQASQTGMEVASLVKRYGLPALNQAGSITGLAVYFETGLGVRYAGSRRDELHAALKRLRGENGYHN